MKTRETSKSRFCTYCFSYQTHDRYKSRMIYVHSQFTYFPKTHYLHDIHIVYSTKTYETHKPRII